MILCNMILFHLFQWVYILENVHVMLGWCSLSSVDPSLSAEVALRLSLVLEAAAACKQAAASKLLHSECGLSFNTFNFHLIICYFNVILCKSECLIDSLTDISADISFDSLSDICFIIVISISLSENSSDFTIDS